MSAYTCPYCDTPSSGQDPACPGCGAPIDIQLKRTPSGWIELPGTKDMARIQCGRSSVQIEGSQVPVADFALADGEGVYFAHHELLWKDPSVAVHQSSMKGGWKRMLAGLPIHMLNATGPGRIAFSRDAAGETIALPIHPGRPVDVREHIFMVATNGVQYDFLSSDIWFRTQEGDETETHYPIGWLLDRFSVPTAQPGLVLLHAHGNAFVRTLGAGESILVKPNAFLYKDATASLALHFEHPHTGGFSFWRYGERYLWLRITGPGKIAIQSAYGHHHDPGHRVVGTSGSTRHQW
jgi:uncharacterized protein (AIM24 family)